MAGWRCFWSTALNINNSDTPSELRPRFGIPHFGIPPFGEGKEKDKVVRGPVDHDTRNSSSTFDRKVILPKFRRKALPRSRSAEDEPDRFSTKIREPFPDFDHFPLDLPLSTTANTTDTAAHNRQNIQTNGSTPTSSLDLPELDSTPIVRVCQNHPDRNIQSCPRECSWNLEQANESSAVMDGIELSQLTTLDVTAVDGISTSPSLARPSRIFQQLPHHRPLNIKTCHILILLGTITIIGSLTGALWRTEALDDASGGFALGQYFLAVGALVMGCWTAVHVKYCRC